MGVRVRRAWQSVLLGVLLVSAVLLGVRWGKVCPVAELSGEAVGAPVGRGRTVAWIERQLTRDRLVLRDRRGPSRPILSGTSLDGVTFDGDRLLVTQGQADGAARLLSLDLRGHAQQTVSTIIAPAQTVVIEHDWICGLSDCGSALPTAPYVVAAAGPAVIWVVPRTGGRASNLAWTWGGAPEGLELLGVSAGHLYWLRHTRWGDGEATAVLRLKLPDGAPEVLATERGRQRGALVGGRVAWTAYSEEAAQPARHRAVVLANGRGDGRRVIADWLAPEVRLISAQGRLYAEEGYRLWRLGERREEQRVVYERPRLADGAGTVAGDTEYRFQGGRQPQVTARGLSWGAKARLALGL